MVFDPRTGRCNAIHARDPRRIPPHAYQLPSGSSIGYVLNKGHLQVRFFESAPPLKRSSIYNRNLLTAPNLAKISKKLNSRATAILYSLASPHRWHDCLDG